MIKEITTHFLPTFMPEEPKKIKLTRKKRLLNNEGRIKE